MANGRRGMSESSLDANEIGLNVLTRLDRNNYSSPTPTICSMWRDYDSTHGMMNIYTFVQSIKGLYARKSIKDETTMDLARE